MSLFQNEEFSVSLDLYLCLNCCRLDVVLPLCVPFGRATTGSWFKLDLKEKATKNGIKHESAQKRLQQNCFPRHS